MKITKLFLAAALLLSAFVMPGSATVTQSNCFYTCSTLSGGGSSWSGSAWASSFKACSDGCKQMCGTYTCTVTGYGTR